MGGQIPSLRGMGCATVRALSTAPGAPMLPLPSYTTRPRRQQGLAAFTRMDLDSQVWNLEDTGGSIVGGAIKLIQKNKANPPPPRDPRLPPKPPGQTVASFRKGLGMLPEAIGRNLSDKIRCAILIKLQPAVDCAAPFLSSRRQRYTPALLIVHLSMAGHPLPSYSSPITSSRDAIRLVPGDSSAPLVVFSCPQTVLSPPCFLQVQLEAHKHHQGRKPLFPGL